MGLFIVWGPRERSVAVNDDEVEVFPLMSQDEGPVEVSAGMRGLELDSTIDLGESLVVSAQPDQRAGPSVATEAQSAIASARLAYEISVSRICGSDVLVQFLSVHGALGKPSQFHRRVSQRPWGQTGAI